MAKKFIALIELGQHYSVRNKYFLLFSLALLIRIIWLPKFWGLGFAGDEIYYWQTAKHIAAGHFTEGFFRPPLWSWLLAIPAAFGMGPNGGRLLSVVIGALLPVSIYFLGRKIFLERTAWLAAWIAVVFPEFIAYSHYLWAEPLYCLLTVLSLGLFFKFSEDPSLEKYFWGSAFVAGVALLAKEFSLATWAGLGFLLFHSTIPRKKFFLSIGTGLFLLPVFLYSVVSFVSTGRMLKYGGGAMINFRQAAAMQVEGGQTPPQEFQGWTVGKQLKNTGRQLYNLWTPNSFPLMRIMGRANVWGKSSPEDGRQASVDWQYIIRFRSLWAIFFCLSYFILMVVGLMGLIGAPRNSFKSFTLITFGCLTAIGSITMLCSRFRLPYLFIFILFSAYFLTNPRLALQRLKIKRNAVLLLACLMIFMHIIVVKLPRLGYWG